MRAHKPWRGHPDLVADRNVQHPEWHFQNPTVLILQAAVDHRPISFGEARLHLYGPAMPGMEGIADFTHIPNMGVVLLSCTTENVRTKGSATDSSAPNRAIWGMPV